MPTAALFRGTEPSHGSLAHRRWGGDRACRIAVIGVLVWSPRGGWPDWYTFLWTPALLLVTLPAPRWATISGIALVAGSSAALVTWGAELSGRLQVAQRDVARLGNEPDPLAVPLLERFGEQALRRARPPVTASEMYALWHGSALGAQGYPAHLALWSAVGRAAGRAAARFARSAASLLATMVRDLPPTDSMQVTQVLRAARRALRPAGAAHPRGGDDCFGRAPLGARSARPSGTAARPGPPQCPRSTP